MLYKIDGEEFETQQEYKEALLASEKYFNAYSRWSPKDDEELVRLSRNLSVKELSLHFKRMPGGIASRLRKLEDLDVSQTPEAEQIDATVEKFQYFFDSILSGYHPITGEVFTSDSVWKSDSVIETIQEFLQLMNEKTYSHDGKDSSGDFPF
ncbi:hypothetical protein N9413_08900 [Paracoccaceae bacterium]|nr:hypothetical protein [Paracoccaceae bacterium]